MVSVLWWPQDGQVMVDSAIMGFLHLFECSQAAPTQWISGFTGAQLRFRLLYDKGFDRFRCAIIQCRSIDCFGNIETVAEHRLLTGLKCSQACFGNIIGFRKITGITSPVCTKDIIAV